MKNHYRSRINHVQWVDLFLLPFSLPVSFPLVEIWLPFISSGPRPEIGEGNSTPL